MNYKFTSALIYCFAFMNERQFITLDTFYRTPIVLRRNQIQYGKCKVTQVFGEILSLVCLLTN